MVKTGLLGQFQAVDPALGVEEGDEKRLALQDSVTEGEG